MSKFYSSPFCSFPNRSAHQHQEEDDEMKTIKSSSGAVSLLPRIQSTTHHAAATSSARTRRLFYMCMVATLAYVCYSSVYVSYYTKQGINKTQYRHQMFSGKQRGNHGCAAANMCC